MDAPNLEIRRLEKSKHSSPIGYKLKNGEEDELTEPDEKLPTSERK